MADSTYVDGSTLLTADTMNDLNRLHYTILSDPADVAAVKATLHAAPGAIGGTTPAAAAFTTITSTGGIQTTGAVASGYGTGAGGTVTQATSKSTAVTLDKPTGKVTMHNATLNAAASVVFVLNNTKVAATDTLSLAIVAGSVSSIGDYNIWHGVGAGVAYIWVKNISAGNLSEAVEIQFNVHKGATS